MVTLFYPSPIRSVLESQTPRADRDSPGLASHRFTVPLRVD